MYAALELCERAFVVDHEVGAGTFELSGHLRRDHVHRLGGIETSIFHESLVTQCAIRVDENDAVEAISHVTLEQERDVAHDDAVAALPRTIDEAGAQALDLGVDDLIQLLELLLIGEDNASERRTVELAVGRENRVAPSRDNLIEGGRTKLDGSPCKNVGVDDRRAALGQHLSDGRFTASDVPRESNQQHGGFL